MDAGERSGWDGAICAADHPVHNVDASGIRKAEAQIAACERCRPEESGLPFECVLADVLGKRGMYDFVLIEAARCPNCRSALSEKTLVERHGGIETCVSA